MDEQKDSAAQKPEPRSSKIRIISFLIAFAGFLICLNWPMLILPAVIIGVGLALCGIFIIFRRRGTIFPPPIFGFLIPILAILLAILMPAINKIRMIAQKDFCITHLKGLGIALRVYSNDYNDCLPPANQWCDLLITKEDVAPKSLLCPYSDAIEGESSYAININTTEKNTEMLPNDMVLLFETEAGVVSNGQTETVENRPFYQFFQKQGFNEFDSIKDNIVYPTRWNLSGGPEILTTRYHKGKGCNVLFADGHVEFVPAKKIPTLRWTAEIIPDKSDH